METQINVLYCISPDLLVETQLNVLYCILYFNVVILLSVYRYLQIDKNPLTTEGAILLMKVLTKSDKSAISTVHIAVSIWQFTLSIRNDGPGCKM